MSNNNNNKQNGATDDGFNFMWRQVLCFVNDNELFRDAAAADVGQGFEVDFVRIDQVVGFFTGNPLVAVTGLHQIVQVVENQLHLMRLTALCHRAGIRCHLPNGTIGRDTRIFSYLLRLMVDSSAAARANRVFQFRPARPGNNLNIRVHQKFERHRLFFVAGRDVPDRMILLF